jgi:hypothetical protein
MFLGLLMTDPILLVCHFFTRSEPKIFTRDIAVAQKLIGYRPLSL